MDLVDCRQDRYLRSIPRLPGVAGVLVSNERDLVFTSNREEKTVSIFKQGEDANPKKVRVGGRPNGLAFDPSRNTLLSANVPRPGIPEAVTVSLVDVKDEVMVADVPVPGRTRWTVFDPKSGRFYVNISEPSQIAFLSSREPDGLAGNFQIPAKGPHGLDLDVDGRRLFCACDDGSLWTVDLHSAHVRRVSSLSGPPDVIFYNSRLKHLYVAVGDPGVLEVFDARDMSLMEAVQTQPGTHTLAFNPETNKIYAFMPESHRAAVYLDS